MNIALITITYEWDDVKNKYVIKNKQVNPNLKEDIERAEQEVKEKRDR
jgi:hypothetical protein